MAEWSSIFSSESYEVFRIYLGDKVEKLKLATAEKVMGLLERINFENGTVEIGGKEYSMNNLYDARIIETDNPSDSYLEVMV